MKTIAIVDCAINEPSIACYYRLLKLGFPVSYHSARDFGLSTLENIDEFHAAFIFGSNSNVVDNETWHKELGAWGTKALKNGLPILGICFGHQLMCHQLGADIIKSQQPVSNCKGTRLVKLKKSFGQIEPWNELEFVVSHSYKVANLPDSLEEISVSDFSNDIVEHKVLPFVGIQPHPEASDHFINTELCNSDPVPQINLDRTKVDGIRFISNFVRKYCHDLRYYEF